MNIELQLNTLFHTIKDPVLGLTAKEMNLQYHYTQSTAGISLNLVGGFPVSLLESSFKNTFINAFKACVPGVNLDLKMTQEIKAHKTQLVGKALRGVKNTIAVASGKGGVGKSTLTVNLAVSLARQGARVGILDADIYGPSIPMMLGATTAVQLQGERYLPILAHGVQAMSIGYLAPTQDALIWRGPMLAKSLLQMIDITLWDELDYLFIDLPPGTGDIQLTLVQKIPLTGAVIVTTPQTIATLDAQKALSMFDRTNIHVIGIIENMALHVCSQCGHESPIFGSGGAQKLCLSHNCDLLGQLPLNAQIGIDGDQGHPFAIKNTSDIGHITDIMALKTAINLAQEPLNYASVFPNIVVK